MVLHSFLSSKKDKRKEVVFFFSGGGGGGGSTLFVFLINKDVRQCFQLRSSNFYPRSLKNSSGMKW